MNKLEVFDSGVLLILKNRLYRICYKLGSFAANEQGKKDGVRGLYGDNGPG